jgi:hypothetical protein
MTAEFKHFRATNLTNFIHIFKSKSSNPVSSPDADRQALTKIQIRQKDADRAGYGTVLDCGTIFGGQLFLQTIWQRPTFSK